MARSTVSGAFLLLALMCALFVATLAVGRNPTSVEHNACRVKWAEQVKEVKRIYRDDRARVVAFNRGLDGSPCMTSCRILFRGNTKEMDEIYTPDDVQCASGTNPRFCHKGRCLLPARYRASEQIDNENEELID